MNNAEFLHMNSNFLDACEIQIAKFKISKRFYSRFSENRNDCYSFRGSTEWNLQILSKLCCFQIKWIIQRLKYCWIWLFLPYQSTNLLQDVVWYWDYPYLPSFFCDSCSYNFFNLKPFRSIPTSSLNLWNIFLNYFHPKR